MIKLIEIQSDFDIGIEYSFILNYSKIEDTRLIFNYEDFKVIVPFDDILGLESEKIKKLVLFRLSKDEIFKGALKSFLRNHRLTKLLD